MVYMISKKPKILILADFFLPAFHAGGPIRSLGNIVQVLCERYEINVVTRGWDLGSEKYFEEIKLDEWNSNYGCSVFYFSKKSLSYKSIYDILKNHNYDLIYINSFFSLYFSIIPILLTKIFFTKSVILVAPRGEFNPGALSIKPTRKKIFRWFARLLCLHRNVAWHATNPQENSFIEEYAASIDTPRIYQVENLSICSSKKVLKKERSFRGLRVIFLSRINRIKNLKFLLQVLSGVEGEISLSIFGPIEEEGYWSECKLLISSLASNVKVDYCGALSPDSIVEEFSLHDVFFFPTLGENYGHVIAEALAGGTGVVVSDNTPWQDSGDGVVTVLPLTDLKAWRTVLKQWSQFTDMEFYDRRCKVMKYWDDMQANNTVRSDLLKMFSDIID